MRFGVTKLLPPLSTRGRKSTERFRRRHHLVRRRTIEKSKNCLSAFEGNERPLRYGYSITRVVIANQFTTAFPPTTVTSFKKTETSWTTTSPPPSLATEQK
ncbi:hypothetical protein MTP99_016133 [Tenebrio molitor]|nr:hypothetical protein MTP99_016133 [Tenebrio molitor]